MDETRTALVLGGGGILGAAFEIGALAAMEERWGDGVLARRFELFVGTSAGSFVAAMVSQGIRPGRLYRAYVEEDPELMLRPWDVSRVRWGTLARGLLRLLWAMAREAAARLGPLQRPAMLDIFSSGLERLPAGFLTIEGLEAYLCRVFEREGLSNRFQDLASPLLIPAVDLDGGALHIFGQDPGRDPSICRAVTASSAIPQIFAPVEVGGRHYVDGVVGGATHLELALARGARRVLYVNPVVASCVRGPEEEACSCRLVSRGGLGVVMDQCQKIQLEAGVAAGVAAARHRHPEAEIVVIQPSHEVMPAGGLMRYEAHREALAVGHGFLAGADEELVAALDGLLGGKEAAA